VNEFYETYIRPWGPRRRIVIGAGIALAAVLAARWWLDVGPQVSYAAELSIRSTGPLAAGIQPRVRSVGVQKLPSGHWDLMFDLEWTCPGNRVGIESATGWLRVWPQDDPDLRLYLPCQLYAPVTPGHPTTYQLTTDWDDHDPVHEAIRRSDPSQLRAIFTPEQAVLADRPSSRHGRRLTLTRGQSSTPNVGSNPWASRKAPAKALPK